jgi:YVTN family beta-propeller protein
MGRSHHAASAALALVELAACGGDGALSASTSASPTPSDPGPVEVLATVTVGNDAIGIAAGAGDLWVVNAEVNGLAGSLSRIDPATNDVLATIPVGPVPLEVAVGLGSVWVSNSGSVDTEVSPEGIVQLAGSIWVATTTDRCCSGSTRQRAR